MSARRHLRLVEPPVESPASSSPSKQRPAQLTFGMPNVRSQSKPENLPSELDRIAERLRSSGRGVG